MEGKQHWVGIGIVWAILTALGVWLTYAIGILPSPGAREAHLIDDTVTFMTALAVPIFMLVVVVLVYALMKFSSNSEPTEDGPPIQGNTSLQTVWVVTSFLLVVFLAWFGAKELIDIRGAHAATTTGSKTNELVVQVNAFRFGWDFVYPSQQIKVKEELVLPKDRQVRFEVNAVDVLHSFWIPAFRVKIDAVPGTPTIVIATPDRLGAFKNDVNYRVQCAELCGAGHGVMTVGVSVVEPSEFDAWVAKQPKSR